MITGLVSGSGAALSGPDQTCGDSTISAIDDTSPPPMPTTAPIVLKRRQVSDSSGGGKVCRRGDREREAGQQLDVERLADAERKQRADPADDHDGHAACVHLLALAGLAVAPHRPVDVVRRGGGGRQRGAGHDREDRRECDRADHCDEHVAAGLPGIARPPRPIDQRAARGSGTVRKRIRMFGSPSVPRAKARPVAISPSSRRRASAARR